MAVGNRVERSRIDSNNVRRLSRQTFSPGTAIIQLYPAGQSLVLLAPLRGARHASQELSKRPPIDVILTNVGVLQAEPRPLGSVPPRGRVPSDSRRLCASRLESAGGPGRKRAS